MIEIYDLPSLQSRAAFLSVNTSEVFRDEGEISPVTISDSMRYMPWGTDNLMPYDVLDTIESDETMTTCLQFNAEICYGSGLVYNCDAANQKTAASVEDFCDNNDMASLFMGCCQDIKHFGFCVTEIILSNDASSIVSILRKNACYCRFAVAEPDGSMPYILYANWRNSPTEEKIEKITLLSLHSPLRHLKAIVDSGGTERKFAILTKIPTADNCYYPIPFYASLFRSNWLDIKKLIALAKKTKLQNSAPIRYHVEISARYWKELWRREGITDPTKQSARQKKEMQQILDFLTGVENSGKVWFSTYYISPDGKEQHDVVINKIDTAKEGGDWESDIQEAINIICFAMRVHSNLVGSVPGKAQSNNSGSDKRELYTIAQALQKPMHDLLMIPHKMIIKFNGWTGVRPECPFIQLTTLDEKKDAKQVLIN